MTLAATAAAAGAQASPRRCSIVIAGASSRVLLSCADGDEYESDGETKVRLRGVEKVEEIKGFAGEKYMMRRQKD